MMSSNRPLPRTVIVSTAAVVAGFLFAFFTLFADDFRVTSIQVTNNDVRITWNAPGGSNYVVQSATPLNTNFVDLSPVIFVPTELATNYIHGGGLLTATSRYYRVRSFPAPIVLQNLVIYPTNATIGVNMTNRYQVFAVYSDNTTQDVTTLATLTSLNSAAQVVGVTNGFALVRGNSAGVGTNRVVYQGVTNTVNLTVSQLTGLYTVPPLSQINGYVDGTPRSNQVMGIFLNGQTNNITPSSNLESAFGGAPVGTRVDYNLRADVANSFALITGQSAAAEDLVFSSGQTNQFGNPLTTSSFPVNWCWFTSITLQPQNAQINVGEVLQFTVMGQMANGQMSNALALVNDFSADPFYIAQTDIATLRVTGLFPSANGFPSPARISVNVNNGPGSFCSGGLTKATSLTVVCPGHEQVDQTFNGGSRTSSESISAIALQSDGKILINGGGRITRLNTNGAYDPSFNPGSGSFDAIVVQPDGQILIGGSFNNYNGIDRSRIARLNSDGSLDTSFNPGSGANGDVRAIALQPDGKILIGGFFSTYDGTNRRRIARVNSDGTLDTTFNVGTGVSGSANGFGVNVMALRPDGKILIAGYFSGVNGTNRNSIARLNSNGGLDTGFNPGAGPNGEIFAIAEQPDGKVVVGGFFTTYNGIARNGIARLTVGGSLETGFNPTLASGNSFGNRIVNAIAVQPDSRVIIGGLFNNVSSVLSYKNILRLEANGNVDTSFCPCGSTGSGTVQAIAQDKCLGHAYPVGSFITMNGVSRYYIARLLTGSVFSSANDNFEGRIPLNGFQVITNGNNACATKESGEPNHADNIGGKSLWWSWIAPTSGSVTISSCGSDCDTLLAVYTGNLVNALTLVASNDNSSCLGSATLQSQVQVNAVAGTEYQIAVDGFKHPGEPSARSGNIILSMATPVVFAENFDADHTANWRVNAASLTPTTNSAEFFFDYSTVGIPSAPNSIGGTTRGLKLQANKTGNVFSGLSVSPLGQSFSGDYELRFDMWLNFNGPLDGTGNGTTQLTGAGIGTGGTTVQWAGVGPDSIHFDVTGDGQSTVDYRAYSSAFPTGTGYPDASTNFAAGPVTGNRNDIHLYYAGFGGRTAPPAQVAGYPQQTGTTRTGAQGFKWRDVRVKKIGNNVTFSIDGRLIATVDAGSVTLGGSNILFTHYDINSASSTDPNAPALLFGLIDNVVVTEIAP